MSASHDQLCSIKAGATLIFDACNFVYKNVDQNSCSLDPSSQFYFYQTSMLSLYKTLYARGTAVFDSGASIFRSSGATLSMPVTMQGAVTYGALS